MYLFVETLLATSLQIHFHNISQLITEINITGGKPSPYKIQPKQLQNSYLS